MADEDVPQLADGPIYGLELVLLTHSKVIKTNADIVVVWLHWCLLRNGFANHGGEYTHVDYHSENLPANLGWNGDKQAYILKYEHGTVPYAVGMYLNEDTIELSMVAIHKSLRIGIAISDLVDEDLQLKEAMTNKLSQIVDEEFIRPLVPPRLQRRKRPEAMASVDDLI